MQVTKVFVDKVDNGNIAAIATVYFDDVFAVHDVRVLKDGRVFFPSRQKTRLCLSCVHRCGVRAKFCESCGQQLEAVQCDEPFFDIAHPLNPATRTSIVNAVKENLS